MSEYTQLSGYMVPDNTRTTLADPNLTVAYQRMGAAVAALPRVITNKEQFKYYIHWQDGFRPHEVDRRPGDEYGIYRSRLESRTVTTQFYGLQARATDHEINEADAAVGGILDAQATDIRQILLAQMEQEFVTLITTSGNYAGSLAAAVSTPWASAGGDPQGAVGARKDLIGDYVGPMQVARWVLFIGMRVRRSLRDNGDILDRWQSPSNPNRSINPTMAGVAEMLEVDEIVVSEMVKGPTQKTTSAPDMTSNTRIWADTNDSAVLAYLATPSGANGIVANGTKTSFAVVSEYGPGELRGMLGDEVRDGSGGVHFANVWDDWAVIAQMVNDSSNEQIIAASLMSDITA